MTEAVLVTGGTGYIAGWCITDLLSRGYRVRTTVRDTARERVVRSAVGTVVDAENRVDFAVADLTSPAGWAAAVDGVDYVLHVASPLSSLRDITVSLGRRNRNTTEKAERLLGWRPRPSAPTVIDCANSLIAHGVV
jgi:uncharacterized protein YbjT (DUF2867 family)